MVRQDGVGAQVDGEELIQFTQALYKPRFTMLIAFAGKMVLAAEKGTTSCFAYTTADTVVARGGLQRSMFLPGAGHGVLLLENVLI